MIALDVLACQNNGFAPKKIKEHWKMYDGTARQVLYNPPEARHAFLPPLSLSLDSHFRQILFTLASFNAP